MKPEGTLTIRKAATVLTGYAYPATAHTTLIELDNVPWDCPNTLYVRNDKFAQVPKVGQRVVVEIRLED